MLSSCQLLSTYRTHTPAVTGNILATGAGNVYSVDFNAEVVLNPGVYTIIAHVRFFSANGTIQYDMASKWIVPRPTPLSAWRFCDILTCTRALVQQTIVHASVCMAHVFLFSSAAVFRDVLPFGELMDANVAKAQLHG